MKSTSAIQINIDKILVTLFCCYAFSMPFELILEILFDIDTIFKPFRIMSILIIGTFGLKVLTQGIYLDKRDQTDWFLYGVFLYGIIISCFKIIMGVFDIGLFINDSFQFSLHLATFFIYKTTPISKNQAFRIFRWFMIGVTLNALYISSIFFTIRGGREAGFTDNPNYVAFGLVAASTYLILGTNFKQRKYFTLWVSIIICFLLYTFGIQASRTGFIMFVIASVLIFFYSDLKRKITLVILSSLIGLMLMSSHTSNVGLSGPMVLINRIIKKKSEERQEDVRFVVWRGVFRILEVEGYEGMGIGQFKAKFPQYFAEESNKLLLDMVNYGYFLSAHSDYLAIVTDYGLPSLLLYLFFLSSTLIRLWQEANYYRVDEEEEFLAQFSFIFFLCIIIFGLTAENFQHQLYWFLLMFTTKNYFKI